MEIYIRTFPVVGRVLWAVDINSKIVFEVSSLESVFILSEVVYRIDRDRKCIEFAATDVFKWWNFLWNFNSIPYDLWKSFNGRCEIGVNDTVKDGDLRVHTKHTEMVLQHFYNRFYKEYMLALLERHSLQTQITRKNCESGELLLLKTISLDYYGAKGK